MCELTSVSFASPVSKPTAAVEGVLRRLAHKHRPPVAPPVVFARPHIKMRRKAPTPTIDAPRLLDALGLYLPPFVVDHDEMQTRCFKEPRHLADSCESWSVLCVGHDVVRYAGAQRELALAQVGSRTRCPDVSICWEFAHESSVAHRRSPRVTLGSFGTCKWRLWTDAVLLLRPLCSVAITLQS